MTRFALSVWVLVTVSFCGFELWLDASYVQFVPMTMAVCLMFMLTDHGKVSVLALAAGTASGLMLGAPFSEALLAGALTGTFAAFVCVAPAIARGTTVRSREISDSTS